MKNKWILLLALLALPILNACSDDDSVALATYQVTLYNLTEGQPLSSPVVALHSVGYRAWDVGASATTGLENLAESGDGTVLMTEANANPLVGTVVTGTAAVGPGTSGQYTVSMMRGSDTKLTLAAMLVNTNDGFTGVTSHDVSGLAVGESLMVATRAYDAGTEANSETSATVPGPAGGGTGFNIVRDDVDRVSLHPGVVSNQDGLPTSALSDLQRFDNPTARIVVTRTQ